MLSDVHSDDPLLNNAFDFSRYPIFKTRLAKLSTKPDELRHRGRGRSMFTVYSHGSPSGVEAYRRSRNVSEPQLISSTNYMRESWFTNFASARTVGDVANLSGGDDICVAIRSSQSASVVCDTLSARSWYGAGDVHLQQTPLTVCEDSCDSSGHIEPSDHNSEGSLYSMDSADQGAHPLLLSMPIIPQIKLERKATVREADIGPSSNTAHNHTFLSPRIRDLRTPAGISSRRYGCILARASSPAVVRGAPLAKGGGHGSIFFQASQRFGSTNLNDHAQNRTTQLACTHSTSEPLLNSPYTSDDEEEPLLRKGIDESPHYDMLLSIIEEVDSSPGSYSDKPESGVDEPLTPKQVPKHSTRYHQRSSLNYSISFSSLVQAVADGCASLDHLLRKPKAKPNSTNESEFHSSNAHDSTSKWAPKQGQIIIKVFVPSTDDIWMFRVPQDINLTDFTLRVVSKLGFAVSFSGSLWDEPKYYFRTDKRFKSWVKGRVRFGRNLPIVAHVPAPLPLVKLSVDGNGCEVWCDA